MVSLPVVVLILISSNSPQENVNEEVVVPPMALPHKGFVDNGKSPKDYSPPNDPTTTDFKFPDDQSRESIAPNKKIILEKIVPDEKNEKNKAPVPLYSLVKNDCGEGYALDENGVCQKTIAVRSGKKLDAERRRKRDILNYEWLIPKNQQRTKRNFNVNESRMISVLCNNLYPGLATGSDGCRKAFRATEQPFDKALPP